MRVITFNLYPYRSGREKAQQQKALIELSAAAGLAVLSCLMFTWDFSSRLSTKQDYLAKVESMKQSIALEAEKTNLIKKDIDSLQSKVSAIESVGKEALIPSRVFALLDRSLPSEVVLKGVAFEGSQIKIYGFTTSVPSLAGWLQVLELDKDAFSEVSLVRVIEFKGAQGGSDPNSRGSLSGWSEFEIAASVRHENGMVNATEGVQQ